MTYHTAEQRLNKRNIRSAVFATLLLADLAGCGGGGNDAATSPDTGTTPTPAVPLPATTTLDSVKAFLTSADSTFATALPGTGAERYKFIDSCSLNGGQSKGYQVKDYDDNLTLSQQENAFLVGSTRTNVKVVAERKITNADGTTRLEVDITYDTVYKDGTSAIGTASTLVSGSSAGTCATPTNSADLRFLGDQRKVFVDLQARNIRTDNFSLATGAPAVTTPTSQRRDIRVRVIDAGNVATYAIVTGPGPAGANGQPFSFKLLSPRIVRSAPELAGKVGNATTLIDTDTFKPCRIVGTTVPVAEVADCVGLGVTTDGWGSNLTNVGDTAAQKVADDFFAAQGWVAGGNYTFAIYADDGWKTVNGQAGKTPIATYTAALKSLPYTFAEMNSASSGASYPSFTTNLTTAQIAALFTGSGGPVSLNGLQAAAPSGSPRTALNSLLVFAYGPNIGATSTGYPRTEQNDFFYPPVNATSGTVVIKGKNPATSATTFGELFAIYFDRNGRVMQRRWDFL